jgi:hypothetical protein
VFLEVNVFNITHIIQIHLQDEEYQVEEIRGFVTSNYDRKWWLACVLQVNDSEIQATFLCTSGPSKSFTYSSPPDILWVPASKVRTKVDPENAVGCTYVISEKESCCTTEKLETRLRRLQIVSYR